MVNFKVFGNIVGKGRPRFGKNNVYTPQKTKNYEQFIQYQFLNKYPNFKILEEALFFDLLICQKIPKQTSKKNQQLMLGGAIHPTKKPDIDNVFKLVADALNGIVYIDDKQIVKTKIKKIYSIEEYIVINIKNII